MATLIHNATELQNINLDLAGNYELANDIDCTGMIGRIGSIVTPFTGSLDGKGHTLSNFDYTPVAPYSGLFERIGGGSISNVKADNFSINGSTTVFVGGIVGTLTNGTITNCSVKNSTVRSTYAGGICYANLGGTISGCFIDNCTVGWNHADLNGSRAGGICSENDAQVDNCYVINSVIEAVTIVAGVFNYCGGINGLEAGNTDHCYVALTTITSTTATGTGYAGGIDGRILATYLFLGNSFVDEDTVTISGDHTGSIYGLKSGGPPVINCAAEHTAWMKTKANFVAAGWDFTTPIWSIAPSYNDGYPNLDGVNLIIPTVTTGNASGISATGATLNGTLTDDGGEACDVNFNYGLTMTLGSSTPVQHGFHTGDPFLASLGSLSPGTIYYFQAQATNSAGTITGSILSFTTLKGPTTTVVASSLNPSTYGDSVTFTATVSPSLATGTVQFYMDGVAYGFPIALAAGAATITLSTLIPGIHTIEADYSGDGSYLPSSGTLTQTVNKVVTTTGLVSSLNPAPYGYGVTFTATVSPAAAPGQVQFTIDGYGYWVPVNLVSGIASVSISDVKFLTVGTHVIKADYLGDSNYLPSSDMLSEVVLAVNNRSNPVSRRKW